MTTTTVRLTRRQADMLRFLARSPGGSSLAAVTRGFEIGRLSALCTLRSLMNRGLVHRDHDRYGYVLYRRTEEGARVASG